MRSFQERLAVGVAFDILLHQPAMLGTLTLLLAKVEEKFCVVQPMLEERQASGSLVYLPGNPAVEDLYQMQTQAPTSEVRVFDAQEVNHSHWIWGMTPSFLSSAMSGEGFSLTAEEVLGPLPNPRWQWWGAVYERTGPTTQRATGALTAPPPASSSVVGEHRDMARGAQPGALPRDKAPEYRSARPSTATQGDPLRRGQPPRVGAAG